MRAELARIDGSPIPIPAAVKRTVATFTATIEALAAEQASQRRAIAALAAMLREKASIDGE